MNESDLAPPGSVDAQHHLTTLNYVDGDPPVKTTIKFSDYKTNIPVPDSKFMLKPPAGFSSFSVRKVTPPHGIGETLPPATVVDGSGHASKFGSLLHGKPGFIAIVDPTSPPSLSSLAAVGKIKDINVFIVNLNASGTGVKLGSAPILHDPSGKLASDWRVGATPTFYLVDGAGKITNVWYGFDQSNSSRFATEVSDAVGDLSS